MNEAALLKILTGINLATNLLNELSRLGELIQAARREGRELTQEELDAIDARLEAAKAAAHAA